MLIEIECYVCYMLLKMNYPIHYILIMENSLVLCIVICHRINSSGDCFTCPFFIMIDFFLRSALLNAGYHVSTSHARQDSIKTNAPHHIIWDVMRAFAEQSPTKRGIAERLNTDSPYYRLLTKPSTITVDFSEHPDWESEARKNRLIRFMANPHDRWGPLGKAVTTKKRSIDEDNSVQNKKQVRLDFF